MIGELFNPKVNCYTCIHRGSVAGSAHSCCKHPAIKPELKTVMMLRYAQGIGHTNPTGITVKITKDKEVKEFPLQEWNKTGISGGWVLYPDNFDPVWLERCFLYEGVKQKSTEPI